MLAKEELVATFAARGPLLDMLIDDLRGGGHQHHLLIGQRGAGKTTLLLRLACAIEDDPALAARALPLRFPEEQYNVGRLSDFWLNCVDALIDALERRGDAAAARKLDAEVDRLEALDEDERAREALALLVGWARDAARLLVMLVDNVDLVLERLSTHHWALRDVLSADNALVLIGASSSWIQESFDYGQAFYDFFNVHELAALSEGEARAMLEQLADAAAAPQVREALAEPGRFAALHLMSGGMPRTLVLLHRILAAGSTTKAEDDLEALLDQVTPYYKARFDELAPQSQQVMHALAMHWHPMTAIDCAAAARLDVNTVSAQLNRLVRQGVVSKLATAESAKLSFLISERLFAIWYSMRASRRLRRKLLWLVEAIEVIYGQAELARRAQALVSADGGAKDPARLLAYAAKVEDPALRSRLELLAVQAVVRGGHAGGALEELLDVHGEDRHLLPIVDRVRALGDIARQLEGSSPRGGEASDDSSFWLRSHPLLSLADKVRLAGEPDRLRTIMAGPGVFLDRARALREAVAEGAVPSLADAAGAEDLCRITDLAAVDLASGDAPSAPRVAGMIVTSATIAIVVPYLRAREAAAAGGVRRSATLLREVLALQADDLAIVCAAPSLWMAIVRAGMAGDAADALRDRGWADRLVPIYEALRAVAGGRLELAYLAPEVRAPTEEALSTFLFAGMASGYAHEQLAGTASRAAERSPTWRGKVLAAAATRLASRAAKRAVEVAADDRPRRKPRSRR
ncbi:MAG TPA: ATP-binding protein [Kofleriaceae bacterium]|nr:ATP-binding protein [Kofleriaceae bacterium]